MLSKEQKNLIIKDKERLCSFCGEFKPWNGQEGLGIKASGFHGNVCYNCHKFKMNLANQQRKAYKAKK